LLGNTGQQPGPKSGCVNIGLSGTPKLILSLTLLGSARYKKYRIKKIKPTVELVIGYKR